MRFKNYTLKKLNVDVKKIMLKVVSVLKCFD